VLRLFARFLYPWLPAKAALLCCILIYAEWILPGPLEDGAQATPEQTSRLHAREQTYESPRGNYRLLNLYFDTNDDYLRGYVAVPMPSPEELKRLDGKEVQVRWTTQSRGSLLSAPGSTRYLISLSLDGIRYITPETSLGTLNADYRLDLTKFWMFCALYVLIFLVAGAPEPCQEDPEKDFRLELMRRQK
jgi:hypothetical protein